MQPLSPLQVRVLLATAALSSSVGLVLELMLVTQASYLLGDAALATGMVIGTFLAAMGLGAWLSQFVGGGVRPQQRLLNAFLLVELCLSPLCLLGPLALFALFSVDGPLWLALVVVTVLVGVLGGMEVPLLTRLLESQQHLRKALARVLALDYLGALLGSLLFSLLLLPVFGLLPTAGLLAMVPLGNRIEDGLYDDPVVGRVQSRHQRIVLTSRRGDLRLFLDGNLQFSSLDEYRYHEALVHPALALHGRPERVLLLGAGDGLAAREILRWPGVRRLDLVELDPQMLQLARVHPFLRRLNQASLDDPRVQTHVGDAFELVRRLPGPYDVVIADFPDPESPALARLYSVTFYGRLLGRLAPGGLLVTQASTPFFTPKVMASIQATLAELDLVARPYSVDVPSFGPWGFVLAHRQGQRLQAGALPFEGRWFDRAQLDRLFLLPRDLRPAAGAAVLPNRLSRPVLDGYQRQSLWRQD